MRNPALLGVIASARRGGGGTPYAPFDWNKVSLAMSGENLVDESQYEWVFDAIVNMSGPPAGTQAKFGSKALYLAGVSGATGMAMMYANPRMSMLGDFTVDFWYYPLDITIVAKLVGQRRPTDGHGWEIYQNSTGTFFVQFTSSFLQTGAILVANTWQHIRVVRSGASVYLFYNGVLQVSGTPTIDAITAGSLNGNQIANNSYGGVGTRPINGYIDELIISEESLGTSNFSVPTAAFPRGSFAGFSTWDAANKGAAITLSASARNARSTGSANSVRGTQGRATGGGTDYYFEVSSAGGNANPDQVILVGVGDSSVGLTSYPGSDAHGWGFYPGGPSKYHSGSSAAYGAATDTIGVWLKSNGDLYFKTSSTDPVTAAFTGLSGTFYPMWGQGSGAGDRQGALNVGATTFRLGLPAGATAWH